MNLNLPEVHITFIVVMSLLAFVLAFIEPHYTKNVKTFIVVRRLLLPALLLVVMHFWLQYELYKSHGVTIGVPRLLLNLIFGFPVSYLFTMSLMYHLRNGRITVKEWLFVPLVYLIALVSLAISLFLRYPAATVLPVILVLYFISLCYCSYLQIRQYFYMRACRRRGDHSYDVIMKWTQWSIFLMSAVGLGFPPVLLVNNPIIRSIYGLMTIAVVFIYLLGLMGYSLNYNILAAVKSGNATAREKEKTEAEAPEASVPDDKTVDDAAANIVIDSARMAKVTSAAEEFVRQRSYTRAGITLKEAADEMNVSVYLLKTWLRTTEYQKFNTWIMELRINYSKELLMSADEISNDVIAERCGFCDRQYFQSQFSKMVGVTPSKWVKSQGK